VSSPPEMSLQFTERITYLPLGHAPPLPLAPVVDSGDDRDAARMMINRSISNGQTPLTGNAVLYTVLSSPEHVSREVFAAWHDIASSSDGSFVWVPEAPKEAVSSFMREGLLRAGTARENKAKLEAGAKRVLVTGSKAKELGVWSRIGASEAVLDTFAVSNGPVVALAASRGVGAVTRPGATFASRAAAEHLAMLSCTRLVLTSHHYLRLSLSLSLSLSLTHTHTQPILLLPLDSISPSLINFSFLFLR
jgi:predicted O-linked N-acetylglucosamine transferase (SPINDLY family)